MSRRSPLAAAARVVVLLAGAGVTIVACSRPKPAVGSPAAGANWHVTSPPAAPPAPKTQPAPRPDPACPEGNRRMCGVVAAHNAVRRGVNPPANPPLPPLKWSPRAAQVAQAWANRCEFEHNPNLASEGFGENLFAVWGADATPEEVLRSWNTERTFYNYSTNACSKVCGHYTQVVWRNTTAVGCGVAKCDDGMELWVCDYEPAGNWQGQRPY